MARIYDNIEINFTEGLRGIVTYTSVKHVDFCVGYFNLRGWNLVVEQIDQTLWFHGRRIGFYHQLRHQIPDGG